MASQAANLFAPPTAEEIAAAKAQTATRAPSGPVDLFAPPTEEEIQAAKKAQPMSNGLIQKQNVQDELGHADRARLSFASNDLEKAEFIKKQYPGADVREMDTGEKDSDGRPKTVPVVRLPGEQRYRYFDDPSLTMKDVTDFAGDLPSIGLGVGAAALASPTGPGAIIAAGAGSGAGEVARKEIGHGLIGIPRKQSAGEYAGDVAIATGAGLISPFLLSGAKTVVGGLLKRFGRGAGGELADKAAESLAPKPGLGISSPVVPEVAPTMAPKAPSVNTSDDLAGSYLKGQERRMAVPETLDELTKGYRADQAAGKVTGLPSKAELEKALGALPDLETKPTRMHLDGLDSRQANDIARVRRELPIEEGEALNYYEQKMKKELVEKFKGALDPLVKREAQAPVDAAETLMEAVKTRHANVRATLAPEFDKLRSLPSNPAQELPVLQERIMKAIPSLRDKIEITSMTEKAARKALAEGKEIQIKAQLKPYAPSMGISKATYNEINEVLADVSSPKTFKEMQNIREALRKALDPVNPKATRELESLRGALLEHMEDLAAQQNPGVNVRELFKAYAQNESRYDLAQKLMKGSLDTLDPTKRPSPEKVLGHVFRDVKSVQAAKEAFGEQEVQGMLHDLLNDAVNSATKQGNVSSAKLQQFLAGKRAVIEAALEGADPQTAKAISGRLQALVDVMRIVPDAPPVNPSGSTSKKGLIEAVGRGAKAVVTGDGAGLLQAGKQAGEAIGEARAGSAARKELDQIMKGIPPEERGKGLLRKGLEKVDEQLQKKPVRGAATGLINAETTDQGRKAKNKK